ncbi:MAG: hypothetical protein PVJ43_11175 [Gemmatimonadales bacterium]|jgi:hypothetical protein
MNELDSLQKQLAREEDLLSSTEGKIDSARQKIESLRRQIETSKNEIKSTEELIDKLRANGETIKKRKDLLLQYIELAKAGDDAVAERAEAGPDPTQTSEAAVDPPEEEAAEPEGQLPAAADEAIPGDLPYLEVDDDQDLDDLPFVEPPGSNADTDDGPQAPSVSLEDVDEITFTHEVLPHTETFGEELLLVLAHHRKATAPKSVVRIFRRLDYAPKQPATEENVTAQVELNPHHYQYATGGRIALTREGRKEAQRLLAELS